jgi:acyl-coenzyme A synthetase/AMP-(fatty) acid ligase
VVLRAGARATEMLAAELQQWVREKHSTYAYPRDIHFVDALPRSSTGKINRAVLRRDYRRE